MTALALFIGAGGVTADFGSLRRLEQGSETCPTYHVTGRGY